MPVFLWLVALSMLSAAAVMGAIAWRMLHGAREQDSARVELLKSLAFPDTAAVHAGGPSILGGMAEFRPETETASAADTDDTAAPIFAERAAPVAALPRWMSLAAVGTAMALGVTVYAAFARGTEAASATPTLERPLELTALQHRAGSGMTFEVSGAVHNPAGARALSQLVAVVNLVDADGRLLTSQTTPVERPTLEAGQTSAFSLVFPHVTGTVARYRVEFRVHGRDPIPHVDRRATSSGANAPTS